MIRKIILLGYTSFFLLSCSITIISVIQNCPKYDRASQYGTWIDPDKDCQNTRAEVLIEESKTPVTFTSSLNCIVDSSFWYDSYSDKILFKASDVDIDRVVPLAEVHRPGGLAWSEEKRKEYANFMDDQSHLIAVDDSTNQSKSDRDPSEWLTGMRPIGLNMHEYGWKLRFDGACLVIVTKLIN